MLTSPVRARTNPARARINVRSACACTLRCFTGYSNFGSIRANRASVCASRRSSFLRLSPINRTLREFATITSCPKSLSIRLIHGECVPISSAIRLRGIVPKTPCSAFAVLRTLCSNWIWPASSTTQYQLLRSPRSNPMVSFGCEKFLLCFAAAVLTFFIAGLLFICALSTSITWERTASRPETGLLIPSDNVNHRGKSRCFIVKCSEENSIQQMHTYSEQLKRKSLSAQRWSVVLLALNSIGAVIYVIAASHGWVIP